MKLEINEEELEFILGLCIKIRAQFFGDRAPKRYIDSSKDLVMIEYLVKVESLIRKLEEAKYG